MSTRTPTVVKCRRVMRTGKSGKEWHFEACTLEGLSGEILVFKGVVAGVRAMTAKDRQWLSFAIGQPVVKVTAGYPEKMRELLSSSSEVSRETDIEDL